MFGITTNRTTLSKKGAFQENSIVNLRKKTRTSTINRVKRHILRIFSGQTTADI